MSRCTWPHYSPLPATSWAWGDRPEVTPGFIGWWGLDPHAAADVFDMDAGVCRWLGSCDLGVDRCAREAAALVRLWCALVTGGVCMTPACACAGPIYCPRRIETSFECDDWWADESGAIDAWEAQS